MAADGERVVTVRGSGGAVFDLTIPAEGTALREIYDEKFASGDMTLVDPPKPEPKPAARVKE